MKEARNMSQGMWRPSPGTVYYLLKKLRKDENIVEVLTGDELEKAYVITEKGKEALEELRIELGKELKKQAILLSLMMELVGMEDKVEAFKKMVSM